MYKGNQTVIEIVTMEDRMRELEIECIQKDSEIELKTSLIKEATNTITELLEEMEDKESYYSKLNDNIIAREGRLNNITITNVVYEDYDKNRDEHNRIMKRTSC